MDKIPADIQGDLALTRSKIVAEGKCSQKIHNVRGAPDPISLCGLPAASGTAVRSELNARMAFGCWYAAGEARWEPRAVAREPGREPQSRPRAATNAMLRPYHDPRPRLRRGTPQEPGAPAVAVHMADPCRTCRPRGATSAPIMLREAARVLPGRRQKRRRDVWTARVMGQPPDEPHPP